MRIVADGKFLTKPISGIGRATAEIATAAAEATTAAAEATMAAQRDSCEIIFATRGDVQAAYQNMGLNIHAGSFSSLHPLGDVFWGVAHRLPFGLPPDLPIVLSVHDLVWKTYPETMRWRTWVREHLFFSRAVRHADLIACNSHATADDLGQFFSVVKNKIRVVPLGASKPQAKPGKVKKPFALFVGTMEPRKNLQRLIAAFEQLPPKMRDNLDLVIAGGAGWGGVNAQKLVKKQKLEAHIKIIESPHDDVLHQLYADCSFLVMPSLSEGFGLPIAEVLQYGKPVITSDLSSMPEVAASAGLYVNPSSITSISGALAQLINDHSLYASLAKNAIVEAKRFSWGRVAKEMLEIFETARLFRQNKIQ